MRGSDKYYTFSRPLLSHASIICFFMVVATLPIRIIMLYYRSRWHSPTHNTGERSIGVCGCIKLLSLILADFCGVSEATICYPSIWDLQCLSRLINNIWLPCFSSASIHNSPLHIASIINEVNRTSSCNEDEGIIHMFKLSTIQQCKIGLILRWRQPILLIQHVKATTSLLLRVCQPKLPQMIPPYSLESPPIAVVLVERSHSQVP
jgi:hypothetical protein